MNGYKKVIRNQQTRRLILRLLDFVPDEQMVKLQYRIKFKRQLDLKNPQRFTEKLCWYKLNWRDPLMKQCSDKITARDYVRNCGLEHILTPLIGVYDNPTQINFNALPNKFVLKDSLGGGNNEVIVCTDKESIDWESACLQMQEWVRPERHRKHPGREWFYDTSRPSRIICEEYLEPDMPDIGLVDYKFYCFQYGNVINYLFVGVDRVPGNGVQLGIYKADGFKKTTNQRADERPLTAKVPKPPHYEEMIDIAKKLSGPFPHARVDLYDLGRNGGVRFGEITFCASSGYSLFDPDEFDFEIGKDFIIPDAIPEHGTE